MRAMTGEIPLDDLVFSIEAVSKACLSDCLTGSGLKTEHDTAESADSRRHACFKRLCLKWILHYSAAYLIFHFSLSLILPLLDICS